MDRRAFIAQASGATLGASVVAAPAVAQSAPELRWRLTSSFPKSLDLLFGGAEILSRAVSEATDGRFQIQPFAAGEIVPAFQAADAVANNTVEVAQTASYYYFGKDPTFAFGTTIPFGLNARMMDAWMFERGGIDLFNRFLARFNIYGLPAGNTGTQMGGWFSKEVNSVADLAGLKMRISGLGGTVLARLGVVPQQIAASDVYPALERGAIDAAEWIGPYDDEKLGFYKVAPYYYYPGWWEGSAMGHFYINLDQWNELPKSYQAILAGAAAVAHNRAQPRYDAHNPQALRRLVAGGAQLRPFSEEILQACFRAANQLYEELSAQNADFKTMYDALREIRGEDYEWFQVAEYQFDTFMMIQQRNNAL